MLCFHMNGVTYNEAWGMSSIQRKHIIEFIVEIKKKESEAASGTQLM